MIVIVPAPHPGKRGMSYLRDRNTLSSSLPGHAASVLFNLLLGILNYYRLVTEKEGEIKKL